jgi:hypothetical protein
VLQYLHDASRDLGITVLCNLHQVDYAREFADRIVGLSQGRVVFDGAPQAMGQADIDRIYMPQPEPERSGHGPPARAGPAFDGPHRRMNMNAPSTTSKYAWTGPLPEEPPQLGPADRSAPARSHGRCSGAPPARS